MTESDTAYTFNYNSSDKTFTNTNSEVNGSSCKIILTPKKDWSKLVIKYKLESEENYDFFYVDLGASNVLTLSGKHESELELENVGTTTSLILTYTKDSSINYNTESVVVKIYGTNDGGSIVYTQEYLDEIKTYISDVKKKKPAGIQINYMDVNYIKPQLVIKVYMDEDDLRYSSTDKTIAEYLEEKYNRKNHKIGEAIYQSHISRDILSHFDYIKYLEIVSLSDAVDGAIKPNNTQYIELLAKNITIKVVPYES